MHFVPQDRTIRLSIIIPTYRESIHIIDRAIKSVKVQRHKNGIVTEIIISRDDPNDEICCYGDGIDFVNTSVNTGAGLARQRGIDAAHGEYIMFLDADDILYNALAFDLIFKCIEDCHPDIIKFPILEEDENGGFIPHGHDSTWCFSKVFRRQFLIDNNIRFADYRVHEDSYFVRLAELYDPKIVEMGDMIYLWSHNPESTVRRNSGNYWQESFPVYIDVISTIVNKKGEMGKDTTHDRIYNMAYCYATISRMDEEYEKASVAKLAEYLDSKDLALFSLVEAEVVNCLRSVESLPNLPLRLTNYGFHEFLRKVGEQVDGRNS